MVKNLCKNNYLKQGIQDIVYNINKISFLSYKLLNYHFTRLLEENKELPELTQNLFYNASCYVSVMKNRKSTIDTEDEMYKSFSLFSHLLKDLPFRDKMGALINNLGDRHGYNRAIIILFNKFKKPCLLVFQDSVTLRQ